MAGVELKKIGRLAPASSGEAAGRVASIPFFFQPQKSKKPVQQTGSLSTRRGSFSVASGGLVVELALAPSGGRRGKFIIYSFVYWGGGEIGKEGVWVSRKAPREGRKSECASCVRACVCAGVHACGCDSLDLLAHFTLKGSPPVSKARKLCPV